MSRRHIRHRSASSSRRAWGRRKKGDSRTGPPGPRCRMSSERPRAETRVVSSASASSVESRSGCHTSPRRPSRSSVRLAGSSPSQSASRCDSNMRANIPARSPWSGGEGKKRRASRSVVSSKRPRSLGKPTSHKSLSELASRSTDSMLARSRSRNAGATSSARTTRRRRVVAMASGGAPSTGGGFGPSHTQRASPTSASSRASRLAAGSSAVRRACSCLTARVVWPAAVRPRANVDTSGTEISGAAASLTATG